MQLIKITILLEVPDGTPARVQAAGGAAGPAAGGAPAQADADARAIKSLKSLHYDAPEEAVATYGPLRCLEVCAYVKAAGKRIARPGPYINKMLHRGLAVPRGNEAPKDKETHK